MCCRAHRAVVRDAHHAGARYVRRAAIVRVGRFHTRGVQFGSCYDSSRTGPGAAWFGLTLYTSYGRDAPFRLAIVLSEGWWWLDKLLYTSPET